MERKNKKHTAAIALLLQHWSKFGNIEPYHREWAKQYCNYFLCQRNDWVYAEGWTDELVFYVCSGILARVTYDAQDHRHILSVGLPGMAMLSTEHLYSPTQAEGSIIALRKSTLLSIPYRAVKDLKEKEKSLDSFINALNNKKRRQLARLRSTSLITPLSQRYIQFAQRLPELRKNLTQVEQTELLAISRNTIVRATPLL